MIETAEVMESSEVMENNLETSRSNLIYPVSLIKNIKQEVPEERPLGIQESYSGGTTQSCTCCIDQQMSACLDVVKTEPLGIPVSGHFESTVGVDVKPDITKLFKSQVIGESCTTQGFHSSDTDKQLNKEWLPTLPIFFKEEDKTYQSGISENGTQAFGVTNSQTCTEWLPTLPIFFKEEDKTYQSGVSENGTQAFGITNSQTYTAVSTGIHQTGDPLSLSFPRTHLQTSTPVYNISGLQHNIKEVPLLNKKVLKRNHKCDVCEATFTQKGHLTRHLLIHSGQKPHKCEMCNAKFRQKCYLKQHMHTHTGQKPHMCDLCGTTFTKGSSLKTHKYIIHGGARPFKCGLCEKTYTHKGDLNKHYFTHTGHRPHICDICGKTFTQKSHLNTHQRTHNK